MYHIAIYYILGTTLYLVGKGHHYSVWDIIILFNICIDDISNEEVEEKEGGETQSYGQREPPVWKQL